MFMWPFGPPKSHHKVLQHAPAKGSGLRVQSWNLKALSQEMLLQRVGVLSLLKGCLGARVRRM